jgi:hypothetical protein
VIRVIQGRLVDNGYVVRGTEVGGVEPGSVTEGASAMVTTPMAVADYPIVGASG